jgi:hypothetical protein
MRTRIARAVERLYTDEVFLAQFQQDPAGALRPYRLAPAEVEAVKRGDAGELERLGVDVHRYMTDPPALTRSLWLSSPAGRQVLAVFGALVLTLGISFASASPAHAARKRAGRKRRARSLRGRVAASLERAKRADGRTGPFLKRHVRYLGRRYVKNGRSDVPCDDCIVIAID